MKLAQNLNLCTLHVVLTGMVLSATTVTAQSGSAEAIEAGRKEFAENCAACHGSSAKGTGPLASELKKTPPDLTQIAIKNDGHFPYGKIIETIDGRLEVMSHGARDMPVWGMRFAEEGDPTSAQGRILNLTLYLESIQVK